MFVYVYSRPNRSNSFKTERPLVWGGGGTASTPERRRGEASKFSAHKSQGSFHIHHSYLLLLYACTEEYFLEAYWFQLILNSEAL
jgi:hypothetical protein